MEVEDSKDAALDNVPFESAHKPDSFESQGVTFGVDVSSDSFGTPTHKMDYANHAVASACELQSRVADLLSIKVDRCANTESDSPIELLSQDGDSVRFSISQVWKGCSGTNERMGFVSVDYIDMDGELLCETHSHVHCGLSSVVEAKCNDGATVVDLYVHDDDSEHAVVFQEDGSDVSVPDACNTKVHSSAHVCHFRYIIKCRPTLCEKDAGAPTGASSASKPVRRLGQK